MNLKQATRNQARIKMALQGPSGSGKTMSSLLLAYGLVGDWTKIAVIDSENSSAHLYSQLGPYKELIEDLFHEIIEKGLSQRRINQVLKRVSLLVYTPKKLIRIYCPFTVQPMITLGELCQNKQYSVDMVRPLSDGHLAFQINGSWYYVFVEWFYLRCMNWRMGFSFISLESIISISRL